MTEEDVKTIWRLYWDEMMNHEQILTYFNGKYNKFEVKSAINKRYSTLVDFECKKDRRKYGK
ncbi:hypothetical protein IJE86_07890 [bacterium]|nr:hypothetical protein [bacterium]